MLTIKIPKQDVFDSKTNEFKVREPVTLRLEHSLRSVSKWEQKWCKPFLGKSQKTAEESLDYIRCMSVDNIELDEAVYTTLPNDVVKQISDYIQSPATATTFSNTNQPKNREVITSELIYYWMVAQQIPFECDTWHLNRLLTLINVCAIKNAPQKKMSKSELLARQARINAARKQSLNTTG